MPLESGLEAREYLDGEELGYCIGTVAGVIVLPYVRGTGGAGRRLGTVPVPPMAELGLLKVSSSLLLYMPTEDPEDSLIGLDGGERCIDSSSLLAAPMRS